MAEPWIYKPTMVRPWTYVLVVTLCVVVLWANHIHGQQVYKPTEDIVAHVWTNVTSPSFEYPELSNTEFGMPALKQQPSFGVCVSGGGMRATTLAYGWVRALYEMGILQKSRYLSSNSGGSWFNGAFSYTQVPMPQFLGATIPPGNLTMEEAKNVPPGSYAAAISRANPVGDILASTIRDTVSNDAVKAWSDAMGEAFLDPFGVGTHAGTFTTLGTQGAVASRITQQMPPNTPILTAGTQSRPFPIILGSLILPNDTRGFFPFEFSPLYIGVPALFKDAFPIPLGGGFVEPIGFNSDPPAEPLVSPDGSKTVTVRVDYTMPLVQAVGISSSFVAQKTLGGDGREDAYSVEQLSYWNQYDFKGDSATRFGDGGGHDNQAITPLLRRGVEFIIAGSSTVCNPNITAAEWAKCQWDIAGLFGAVPADTGKIDGIEPPAYNAMLQVFPREKYDELYERHAARFKEGGAPFYNQTLQVLRNEYMNIHGNYTVTVLWLFNSQTKDFEAALPSATRKELDKQRNATGLAAVLDGINPLTTNSLATFPLVSTFAMDWPPELVTMMSQQASWTVYQARKEINTLLAAVTPKPQAAATPKGVSKPGVAAAPPAGPTPASDAGGSKPDLGTAAAKQQP